MPSAFVQGWPAASPAPSGEPARIGAPVASR